MDFGKVSVILFFDSQIEIFISTVQKCGLWNSTEDQNILLFLPRSLLSFKLNDVLIDTYFSKWNGNVIWDISVLI